MLRIVRKKEYIVYIPEYEEECLGVRCSRCALREGACWGTMLEKNNKKKIKKHITQIIKDNKPFVEKEQWVKV